jgi:hypothetical protein
MHTFQKSISTFLILDVLMLSGISLAIDIPDNDETDILFYANPIKTNYVLGEAVPVVISIVNLRDQPIYLVARTPGLLMGSAREMLNENGDYIEGEDILFPPWPPRRDPNLDEEDIIFLKMIPIVKIESKCIFYIFMPDAIERFQGFLSAGKFTVEIGEIQVIENVTETVTRDSKPGYLWIKPESILSSGLFQLNSFDIVIQSPESHGPAEGPSINYYLISVLGLISVIIALSICLVRLKTKTRIVRQSPESVATKG